MVCQCHDQTDLEGTVQLLLREELYKPIIKGLTLVNKKLTFMSGLGLGTVHLCQVLQMRLDWGLYIYY